MKTLMRLFPKIGLDESKFNLKGSFFLFFIFTTLFCFDFKFLISLGYIGNYWEKTHNRRKFFVQFARKLGFDPLCAADWYNMNLYKATLLQEQVISPLPLLQEPTFSHFDQGANAVLTYYDDRLVNALVHLFPEIKFNSSQFNTSFRMYKSGEEWHE